MSGTAGKNREVCPRGQDVRYDSLAVGYDRWYETPVNAFIDRLEIELLRECLPWSGQGQRALDVGSGTGHLFPVLSEAGYAIVGLDISPGMLKQARAKFGTIHNLVRGDAMRIPFGNESFDVVCSYATLHLVSDSQTALKEMHRCLRPGGLLIIGALNGLSYLGIKRRIGSRSTFGGTRFFNFWRLRRSLAAYGEPHLATCAFAPPWAWLLPLFGWIEKAGGRLLWPFGQFIVGWVRKPEHPVVV
jgi:SAM-dependent methyltransferase